MGLATIPSPSPDDYIDPEFMPTPDFFLKRKMDEKLDVIRKHDLKSYRKIYDQVTTVHAQIQSDSESLD